MNSERWEVIYLGPQEGHGVAIRRVKVLELFCRGMTAEHAGDLCTLLNEKERQNKRRS